MEHLSYRSQLALPVNQQLEGHELLAYLLQAEKLHRGNDRMESLLKTARFRFNVTSQEIECGKSFVACALGHQACLMGIKTRYFNMNRLIETIIMAKTEGSYMKLLNQLEKIPVIILDDFGIHPINKNLKLALLQIMEDRYAKKSLIITAQMPVSAWHDYIDEPTLADAIMDKCSFFYRPSSQRGYHNR